MFTSGLNPAECEVNFLKIVKNMDFYGVDIHTVVVRNVLFIDLLSSDMIRVFKFDILCYQKFEFFISVCPIILFLYFTIHCQKVFFSFFTLLLSIRSH